MVKCRMDKADDDEMAKKSTLKRNNFCRSLFCKNYCKTSESTGSGFGFFSRTIFLFRNFVDAIALFENIISRNSCKHSQYGY